MADDFFDLTSIKSAQESLEAMRGATRQTAEHVQDINNAFNQFGRARAELEKFGKLGIFDEELIKNVQEATEELGKKIISMGGDAKKLVQIQNQHKKILGDELEYMKGMTREEGKLGKEAETGAKKRASAFGKQAQQVSGYAQQMAGVQLSLIGIIALIIEMGNRKNRIIGAARQVNAQFGEMEKRSSKVYGAIDRIALGFHKGDEAAMNFVRSLSRAGMPAKDLAKLSDKIMSNEIVIGRSVQQQVQDIGALATNFKLTGTMADYYLDTVWKTTKTIPYLSPEEAIGDWKELIDKTKVYNTDLLGTLSLYNTLMRKDLATELGLGDAPRVIRKEIVSTVAGFSRDLEDGWKAALGKGATAAARILDFEKLLPVEQFARMAEFITEKTAGFTGETREIAVRQLLKQFGFTAEETRKVLAEAFAGGGLTPSKLQNLVVETGKSREAMKVTEKQAAESRQKMITEALGIAKRLASFEQRMKDWVKKHLTEPLGTLANAIDRLVQKMPSAKDVKEAGEGVSRLILGPTKEEKARAARAALITRLGREFEKKYGPLMEAMPPSLLAGVGALPQVIERGKEIKAGYPGAGRAFRAAAAEILPLLPKEKLSEAIAAARGQDIEKAVKIVMNVLAEQNIRAGLEAITPITAGYEKITESLAEPKPTRITFGPQR